MDPVSLSKHVQSTSIGQQNGGARGQPNVRAHEWQWGALHHIWRFLWAGISWDSTVVSTVVQETGFERSRNNQKCSSSQGEPGAVQRGISAISVHKSEIEKFSGKIVEINVRAIQCVMYELLMKETNSFAEFSQTCETIRQIWNELLDWLNRNVISSFSFAWCLSFKMMRKQERALLNDYCITLVKNALLFCL